MLRLLGVELKKLLGKKYIWFILLALTVYWGYSVGYQQSYYPADPFNQALWSYQESISGPLTQEKYEKILADIESVQGGSEDALSNSEELMQQAGRFTPYNAASDLLLLGQIKIEADYIINEARNRELIIQQAQRNLDRLREQNGSAYEIRVNEKIIDMYRNSKELMLTQTDCGWSFYFSSNNHTILLLLFLLIVLTPIFSREYESNMFHILYPTRGGRGKTAAAKILAAALVSAGAALYFETVNFFCYGINYKMYNWNLPVRNFRCFSTSPFNFTIGQYVLIKLALFVLFAVLSGLIILFFSKLFSRTIPALISSVVLLGGMFSVAFYFTAPPFLVGNLPLQLQQTKETLKNWLPSFLVHPDLYFNQFDVVNVMGIPVFSFWIAVGIAVLACFAFALAAWLLYTRNISLRIFRKKR